jgi:hypothetical protein
MYHLIAIHELFFRIRMLTYKIVQYFQVILFLKISLPMDSFETIRKTLILSLQKEPKGQKKAQTK